MLSLLWAWSHTVFNFNPGSFLGGYRDPTFPPVSWVVTIAIPSSAVILTLLDIYSLSGYPSPHQNVSSRRAGTLPGSLMNLQHQESAWEDFLVVPWWIHLPVQGTRFHPWSGKIPHAAGQLAHVLLSPCSATREATARRSLCTASRDQPLLATTRESPQAATNTQHSQIQLKIK